MENMLSLSREPDTIDGQMNKVCCATSLREP